MASIMGAPPLLRSLLLGLCTVLLAFNFSGAAPQADRIVAVVGNSECSDCAQKSIENEEAFKGLHVAIQCKTGNGLYETKGAGLLDKSGSFDVQLPSSILRDDGELKDECFAQLRSASEAPCPDNNGLDQSKIVLKSKESGKHTFVVAAGKLPFSSTCTSAFYFKSHPFHKYHYPLHKFLHKFHFHHHYFPHKPHFPHEKPLHHLEPVYKHPLKPLKPVQKPIPVYKPAPIVKKSFPPVHIYKEPHLPIPKTPLLDHPHPKLKLIPHIHKIPHLYHPYHKFKFPYIHKKPFPPIHKPLPFPLIHEKPLTPIPKFNFPHKPTFFKKKPPISPQVKEHPIP